MGGLQRPCRNLLFSSGIVCFPHSGSRQAQGRPAYICRGQRKRVFQYGTFNTTWWDSLCKRNFAATPNLTLFFLKLDSTCRQQSVQHTLIFSSSAVSKLKIITVFPARKCASLSSLHCCLCLCCYMVLHKLSSC